MVGVTAGMVWAMDVLALYPLLAAAVVVLAQMAHTKEKIATKPEVAADAWGSFKKFCYVWAVLLILATLAAQSFGGTIAGVF